MHQLERGLLSRDSIEMVSLLGEEEQSQEFAWHMYHESNQNLKKWSMKNQAEIPSIYNHQNQ
jgi:hypothetical protein